MRKSTCARRSVPILHGTSPATQHLYTTDAPNGALSHALAQELARAHRRQRALCARLDYLLSGAPFPNYVIARRALRTALLDARAVQFALGDAIGIEGLASEEVRAGREGEGNGGQP